jgi:phosphoglycolate phosphatase-like HAD superfamily hydrolase
MENICIYWDWDGTLVNTMPSHANLAAQCMNEMLGMEFLEARAKYLATTGIPFDKQLEKIFPTAERDVLKRCAKRYHKEKISAVYGNAQSFPLTTATIFQVIRKYGSRQHQVISSSTEEELINPWIEKSGLEKVFYRVYGREHGSKADHIKIINEDLPDYCIVFISDSPGDMSLPADFLIGVQSTPEIEKKFFDSGADYVINGPINPEDILEALSKV